MDADCLDVLQRDVVGVADTKSVDTGRGRSHLIAVVNARYLTRRGVTAGRAAAAVGFCGLAHIVVAAMGIAVFDLDGGQIRARYRNERGDTFRTEVIE